MNHLLMVNCFLGMNFSIAGTCRYHAPPKGKLLVIHCIPLRVHITGVVDTLACEKVH